MKLKFYLLLLSFYIAAQSFANISVKITSPTANQLITSNRNNIFLVQGTYTSTYVINAFTVSVGAKQYNLSINSTTKTFSGYISLLNLPKDTSTIVANLVDVLGNSASDSVKFIYDTVPILQVDSPQYVTQPLLHVKAACQAANGPCTIKLINPKTAAVLITTTNVMDTTIDISNNAKPGYWHDERQADAAKLNFYKITATDKFGLTANSGVFYIFEPSPYLVGAPYPGLPQSYIYNYAYKYHKPSNDTLFLRSEYYRDSVNHALADTLTVKPFEVVYTDYRGHHLRDSVVFAINNNFFVWQGYNKNIYRFNFLTQSLDSFAFSRIISRTVVDKSGNFAVTVANKDNPTPYSDTLFVPKGNSLIFLSPAYRFMGIYNNRLVYYGNNRGVSLYNGDTVHIFDSIKSFSSYIPYGDPLVNDKYIAYYHGPSLWLADSAFNITRLTVTAQNHLLFYLLDNGVTVHGYRYGNDYPYPNTNYSVFVSDKYGNETQVSSVGRFYGLVHGSLYIHNGYLYLSPNSSAYLKVDLSLGIDTIAAILKQTKQNSVYSFAAGDFDDAFKGPGHLFKIKITRLPSHGILYYFGRPISVDTVISHATISNLTYKPSVNYLGKDTLRWSAFNGYAFTANDTLFELSVVTTLPVTLTNLTAKNNFKTNLVSWQTTQEVNSAYFDVQKSTDNNTFNSIGTVAAKGNSSITSTYAFTDAQPANGYNYYRLKIVDKDGQYSYSRTVLVKNNGGAGISMYPNPAKTSVQVSLAGMAAGRYNVTVYNANGKALLTKTVTVTTGSQTINLPVSNYAGGVYTVTVVNNVGQLVASQKVVKE